MRTDKRILVDLIGRTGNQLFQIAFAKYLEQKGFGTAFIWHNRPTLDNCLEGLNIDLPHIYSPGAIGGRQTPREFLYRHYLEQRWPFKKREGYSGGDVASQRILNLLGIIVDRSSSVTSFGRSVFRDTYVCGHFERIEFVKPVSQWVRTHFTARAIGTQADLFMERIKREEAVCVTVRRGDFLTIDSKNICTPEWFERAIKIMIRLRPSCRFYIFSDEPDWCSENLRVPRRTIFEPSGIFSIPEKINLMSACDHFIISNSTFSWWAQFLGRNPNKIVLAPNEWERGKAGYPLKMPNWILVR